MTPQDFFFNLPLYTKVKLDSENISHFDSIFLPEYKIDFYNPYIKENTTYVKQAVGSGHYDYIKGSNSILTIILHCSRTKKAVHFYLAFSDLNSTLIVQKIGQYPSIAEFHISQIKKYDKVIKKEKLKEFTRAIGLAANGVGIGSFVYLRRIFEDLIDEAYQRAKSEIVGWDDDAYAKSRMGEKIGILKGYLPTFLVENKTLYGILSVGIHGLTENDCLAYFETVKVGIELILDEKVEKYEKEKKIKDAQTKISNLTSQLKGQE